MDILINIAIGAIVVLIIRFFLRRDRREILRQIDQHWPSGRSDEPTRHVEAIQHVLGPPPTPNMIQYHNDLIGGIERRNSIPLKPIKMERLSWMDTGKQQAITQEMLNRQRITLY